MGNDIKPILSSNLDSLNNPDKAGQEIQAAQTKKAQEAQVNQMARKAAEDSLQAQNQNLHNAEFMSVIDNIVHEGLEGMGLPKTSHGEGTGTQTVSFNQEESIPLRQRDLQVMKEFVREANYLISQGMDISQIVNKLKVDQGGQFWQNFQQILQKQALAGKFNLSSLGESAGNSKTLGGDLVLGKDSVKNQEAMKSAASQAILELIKAESNPQMQKEQFFLALQLLSKGNLTESSQRLLSYLRKKGVFSEQDLKFFYENKETRKDIFQGSIPLERKELKRTSIWYLLLGIGMFGVSFGLGFNLAGSITVGIATVVLMIVFSFIFKK